MDKTTTILASNVRKLRRLAGLTQAELAGLAGISIAGIQDIEYGHTENPKINTVRALAKALKVSDRELLSEDHREPTPHKSLNKELLEAIRTEVKEELRKEFESGQTYRPRLKVLDRPHDSNGDDEVTPQEAKRRILKLVHEVPSIFLPKLYYFFDELLTLIAAGKKFQRGENPDLE